MPNKKTQRRPNRARSRAARPQTSAPVGQPVDDEVVAERAPVPQAPAAPAARPVTRTAALPRRSQATRAGTGAVINYGYLRRDLTMLGILAPAMVIIVVLAFLFIH